jgi:carboxyl-terminal processing protease
VIDSELRDDGVFVIRLFSFTATSPDLFRQALREYIDSGSAHLIVDLRNNPGGYLNAAVDIASWFLPAGEVVARESYGESREETVYRSKGYNVFPADAKLVILQNGGSASASEILAGALREHGVGIIVGTMSFGKGSVQELLKLESGTSLKLTIARWLTPEGVSISEEGLTPDFEIDITADDIEAGEDPQMDAAIKELLDS